MLMIIQASSLKKRIHDDKIDTGKAGYMPWKSMGVMRLVES